MGVAEGFDDLMTDEDRPIPPDPGAPAVSSTEEELLSATFVDSPERSDFDLKKGFRGDGGFGWDLDSAAVVVVVSPN